MIKKLNRVVITGMGAITQLVQQALLRQSFV